MKWFFPLKRRLYEEPSLVAYIFSPNIQGEEADWQTDLCKCEDSVVYTVTSHSYRVKKEKTVKKKIEKMNDFPSAS